MLNMLLIFIIGIIFLNLLLLLFNDKISSRWFCDKFHWHLAPKESGFDGCSFTGLCPRCGKSVLQDSQGNWF